MDSFVFSKVFWGVIIILFGISFIAQAVFKINFPIGRIAVALIFIYIGAKMLFGIFGKTNESATVFSESIANVEVLEDAKYDVVFGSQTINLSNAVASGQGVDIECNVVFGSAKIIIPRGMNVRVKSASVFGSVKTPTNETSFGESEYTTGNGSSNGYINLKVNAVFGSARVYED
jgi:predicted membrane protein